MKRASAHVAAAALFVVLAALMLWPLPRLIGRAVASTHEPLVNTWIYDWDWYATAHRNVPTFRAEMPDHQYGIAVVAFPMRAAGMKPLLAHNVLLLLGFAFTGYGAFVLLRLVTGSWWAGVAAGVVLAFVPWRFTHLAETQFAWAGWLPLMLAALIALGREPTWKRALLFGIALFMNGVSSVHWLVFGSAAIVLAALIFLIRKPRALLLFFAATAVAALLLIPWVIPYRGAFSPSIEFEIPPFPGFAASLLALIGLIGPLGRDAVARQLVLLTGVLWIVLGVAGSLGGFAFIPLAPAAWAMVAYTGLALLAGIGAMKLARGRKLLGALIVAVVTYELQPAPLQFALIDTDEPPVYRYVAESTQRHMRVVELPIDDEARYEYLFRSTIHHRRVLMNEELERAFAQRPVDQRIIERLKALGVTTLVVHGDTLHDETAAAIRFFLLRAFDNGKLRFAGRFDRGVDGDYAFTLEHGDLKPYFGPQPASRPLGSLDEPKMDSDVRGPVRVMGWALAPSGIRRVRVFVNNREWHYDAQLFPRPDVAALYPWHDASRAGFTVDIPRFREGRTDVEVEITDGNGKIARLPQRWFIWSP